MAEWLVGPGFELCMAHYPGLSDLRMIVDMRQMTGRSATARSLLLQQAKAYATCIGHIVLIPSLHMGPTYVKVVEASAMLLRLAGMRVDIEQTVERALAKYDVHAAMAAPQSQTASRPFASRGL